MSTLLQKAWLKRGWLACLLWPASMIFALLAGLRRGLYRTGFLTATRVGVPVLIVGNLVAGGAGKTPLVIALIRHLQSRNVRVGVISRGYGRAGRGCVEVLADTAVSTSGDEPALIHRATGAPVFVATKRSDAAEALLREHPETKVLIADDGLQHYALHRDIEIAVFDDRGVGNGWMLPAGPLREPWPARLYNGIDLVLHSGRAPAFAGFTARRELSAYAVGGNGEKVLLSSLRGRPLVALAAIARPETFFSMLEEQGLTLAKTISLPDHYNFDGFITSMDKRATLLCTEKDAVKLFGLPSMEALNVFAVPLNFFPEEAFLAAVDELLLPLLSQLPSGNGHQIA